MNAVAGEELDRRVLRVPFLGLAGLGRVAARTDERCVTAVGSRPVLEFGAHSAEVVARGEAARESRVGRDAAGRGDSRRHVQTRRVAARRHAGIGIEQGVAPCRVIDPVYGRAQGRRAREAATHSDIEAAVALSGGSACIQHADGQGHDEEGGMSSVARHDAM